MTEPASSVVTILFTDLVGSTELLSRAGDEEAQRIFRAHHDLLTMVASAHGGEEVSCDTVLTGVTSTYCQRVCVTKMSAHVGSVQS